MKTQTFVLHDDSVNTYRFRMLTSGANLEEFRKNPVMFFVHRDLELPIGRWENIRIEDSRILADAVFDVDDPEAKKIADKVERGFIRAASIGTWPPEEVSEDPKLMLPGQTGPTVTKWTVREASIVTIGANHNALRMYDRTTGESVDLNDENAMLRLMDNIPIKQITSMNLTEILNLQDNASDADIEAAVQAVVQENETLKTQNDTLQKEKEVLETENASLKKEKEDAEQQRLADQQAEAVRLVDAAIRDGRLHANGKEAFIALFDADFEKAQATLNAIPRPKSVTKTIEEGQTLKDDFAGKSWKELDRSGLLIALKDQNPDLYREKFREEFGHEPKY